MKGFTFIELLVTLAIMGIVSLLSLPLAHEWSMKHRIDRTTERLVHLVRTARSEAILQGAPVMLCPSRDQKQCGGHWSDGQLLLLDPFGSDTVTANQLLRVGSKIKKPISISLQAFSKGDFLLFQPQGYEQQSNGTFVIRSKSVNTPYERNIIISGTGRVRTMKSEGICYNSRNADKNARVSG